MQSIDPAPVSVDHVDFPRRSSVSNTAATAAAAVAVGQSRSLIHYHLAALSALRPRIPEHCSSALEPIRYRAWPARLHHTLLIFQAYLHLPATIFFDYNGLYVVVQIAFYPDQGQGSSTAWWIASGLYAACFLIWLVVVVAVWEIVLNYKRRWVTDTPFAMPIYESSPAFTLTAIRSFSLYSLLYRTRLGAEKRDLIIETCWFYSQNWPTMLTLLPRGIIIAIVLTLYNPTSAASRPTLGAGVGGSGGGGGSASIRDSVYFDTQTGLLTDFSYVVLLLYAAWIVWRLLVLLGAWAGLIALLGPRFAFAREKDWYKSEYDSEHDGASSNRLSASTYPLLHRPAQSLSNPPLLDHHQGGLDQFGKRRSVRMSSITIAEGDREAVRAEAGVHSPTRARPASVDIPTRTQSLSRTQRRPRLTSEGNRSAGLDALHVQRKQDSFPAAAAPEQLTITPAARGPAWAWQARAEERMRSLLSQCQSSVATDEEAFEWVEIPPRNADPVRRASDSGRRGTSLDAIERHRRSLRDSGRGLAALQLAEESGEHDIDGVEEPIEIAQQSSSSQRSRQNRASSSSEWARHQASLENGGEHARRSKELAIAAPPTFVSRTGDEELIYHDRDDDDDDARSVSTEDSEERRIWSAFPEQSRRHPPGLIALEMQQKQMENKRRSTEEKRRSTEEDRRDRESSVTSVSTGSASTSSMAPASVAQIPLPGSPPMANQHESTPMQVTNNTSLQQLPNSPSEGLLPIEEESWSSTSSTTDEEEELVRSYDRKSN